MEAGCVYHRLKSENVLNYQILTLLRGLRSTLNQYKLYNYGQSPFLEVYIAVTLKNVAETIMQKKIKNAREIMYSF